MSIGQINIKDDALLSRMQAISLIGGVCAIVLVLFLQANAQIRQRDPDDVIRVETKLVTLPVNVVDRQGNFVPDLKKEQFRILEDGTDQPVAYFENYDRPLTVCLLIDTSDSTKFKLAEIKSAAANFIQKLRDKDRIVVMTFDREVNVLNEPTSDRSILMRAVTEIKAGGGTSIYNAVDTSLRQVLDKVKGRNALVIFTDGVDTTSLSATYESTLNIAIESNSAIYVIKYDTFSDVTEKARQSSLSQEQMSTRIGNEPARTVYDRAFRYLMELTELTGGHLFEAATAGHLSEDFDKVLSKLREQYSIGYYPSDVDKLGRRRITVKVNIPNVKVSARRFYALIPDRPTKAK